MKPTIAPVLRSDPVMYMAGAWTVLGVMLLVVLDGHTDAQVNTFWIFQLPLDGLLAYSSWRVSRVATGSIRRFWRVMTGCGALFLFGDTVQAVTSVATGGQAGTAGGVVQSTCFAIGLGTVIVALLVHPFPGRSRREGLAFWLDSATVLVGGAVVVWSFTVQPGDVGAGRLLGTLVTGAIVLTSAFAAVKIVLSGKAPMHRAAAIPMIVSAAVNSVGLFLAPANDQELPAYAFVLRLLPSLLIALGPRTQELITTVDGTAFGARRKKPYSLLPYGSILVAFVALTMVLPDDADLRFGGVVAGLGLICALVAGRQLAAFHDNRELIGRLDATLAELREHEARLRHQAQTDGLTGLANRTHFQEQVTAELADHGPDGVSLLLIDLDGFKEVNDTLGHAAGDALLQTVAGRLREAVRPGDLVGRLGGDEFTVLLRDCSRADAERTAGRILEALGAPVPVAGRVVRANASIGVVAAEPGHDVGSLLRDADQAMYAAKRDGKGTWTRFLRPADPPASTADGSDDELDDQRTRWLPL